MMHSLEVVNIKCGGCSKSIQSKLESAGFFDVSIDVEHQKISFSGEPFADAQKIIEDLGYPEKNSPQNSSLLKKVVSYKSCVVGKFL